MSTSEEEEDDTEQEEEKENSEFSEEEILIKNFRGSALFPSNILLFLVFFAKNNCFRKICCGFIFFLWSSSSVNNDWTLEKISGHF